MVTCPCTDGVNIKSMSVEDIQKELNALIFDDEVKKACNAEDRELLSIIIAQPKAHHFDFLKGKTEWKVRGKWRRPDDGYEIEKNVQLDIEFKDSQSEHVGQRIINLLREYNVKAVGETVLYARTMPIEEGTL